METCQTDGKPEWKTADHGRGRLDWWVADRGREMLDREAADQRKESLKVETDQGMESPFLTHPDEQAGPSYGVDPGEEDVGSSYEGLVVEPGELAAPAGTILDQEEQGRVAFAVELPKRYFSSHS